MTAAAFAVFFCGCKAAQSSSETPTQQNQTIAKTPSPTATPVMIEQQEIPQTEIKSGEINSLALETVYKDYFDEGSKCRKTYNEYFGEADGAFSESSPCTINLTFDRNGDAKKTVEVRRYGKAAREYKTVEKSV